MDETGSGDGRAPQAAGEDAQSAKPRQSRHRGKADLHLSTLPGLRPETKAGQIRWLWPEITAALSVGHSVKEVCRELNRDGIEIPYSRLRLYIAQLRRTGPIAGGPGNRLSEVTATPVETPAPRRVPVAGTNAPNDPLANLRERLANRPGFEYDERPPDISKLI
jgi:hypothetical protein